MRRSWQLFRKCVCAHTHRDTDTCTPGARACGVLIRQTVAAVLLVVVVAVPRGYRSPTSWPSVSYAWSGGPR
jgi:hypothetical protein